MLWLLHDWDLFWILVPPVPRTIRNRWVLIPPVPLTVTNRWVLIPPVPLTVTNRWVLIPPVPLTVTNRWVLIPPVPLTVTNRWVLIPPVPLTVTNRWVHSEYISLCLYLLYMCIVVVTQLRSVLDSSTTCPAYCYKQMDSLRIKCSCYALAFSCVIKHWPWFKKIDHDAWWWVGSDHEWWVATHPRPLGRGWVGFQLTTSGLNQSHPCWVVYFNSTTSFTTIVCSFTTF